MNLTVSSGKLYVGCDASIVLLFVGKSASPRVRLSGLREIDASLSALLEGERLGLRDRDCMSILVFRLTSTT